MPHGYHGGYLRIDLSTHRAKLPASLDSLNAGAAWVPLPETVLRQYLGGSGLGVRLLLNEGTAHLDALDPRAPLIFAFSPLVGSPLTTSAKFAVVSKSPLTNRINDSLASSGFALAGESRPLAGNQVLVMSTRRDVRNQVRQAVAHMGLTLDFVTTTDAAREFCHQGLPHAIVYESALYDSAFDRLRNDIRQQCPELAWIEITEQGEAFEISSFGGMSMARVGRDAIVTSLPSALMFELAKGL